MQYPHNNIEPFGSSLIQLGTLPAYGVSRVGGYSWFSTIDEAYAEIKEANQWEIRSYKRSCPGLTRAIQLEVLIQATPLDSLK